MKKVGSILSVSILSGTIIGAGIFSLPYVFAQVGFAAGVFYLFAFASLYFLIHLFYAQVIQKTGGDHRFVYYAEKYLGKRVKPLAILMSVVEMLLALTIYLILSLSFFELIFGAGEKMTYFIIFWLAGSAFIFLRLRGIAWAEATAVAGILAMVFFIISFAWGKPLSISLFVDLRSAGWKFLFPFGPLLFALAGRSAVDEIAAGLKKNLTKIIFWGTFLPAAVYLVFVWGILKLNPLVPEDAVSGLAGFPNAAIISIGILGLLTLWSSYIVVGANVNEILKLDMFFPKWLAGALVILVPPVLYFAGLKSFFQLIGFTGGIFLALESIFIILMWFRAFKEKSWRWFSLGLIPVFLLAIFYQLALIYSII